MSRRLEGKVAMITGGGSGLGEATALRFAAEGARVYIGDIREEAAAKVAQAISEAGGKASCLAQDVCDELQWGELLNHIIAEQGHLDILVNNAGVVITGTAEDASLEDWRKVTSVNLDGVFMGTREGIRVMKNNGGSIINISSIEGIVGEPATAAYNASKGGVRIFSKSAALHCADKGYNIRINTVHPGFILTPMVIEGFENMPEDMRLDMEDVVAQRIPLGHMGEPADIANGCLYLASDESKYMTGSELVIDGGYTCK